MTRLVAAAAAAFVVFGAASTTAGSQRPPACNESRIGLLAPLSGVASFLGREQLSWARFAADRFNGQRKTKFEVVGEDSELTASAARTAARTLVADRTVLGVVGGTTNGSVVAAAPLLAQAELAAISPSASRPDLTDGRFRTFFRVVPSDAAQVPAVVGAITGKLKAKRVLLVAGERERERGAAFERALRAAGMTVTEANAAAAVRAATADTDLVLYVTANAERAGRLAGDLERARKRAPVFATDAHSLDLFTPARGYTSLPLRDLRVGGAQKALLDDYRDFSRRRTFGPFGPGAFTAAWALLEAMQRACGDGRATRAEVLGQVRATDLPSVAGRRVRFTRAGELAGARFSVYEVRGGEYRLLS